MKKRTLYLLSLLSLFGCQQDDNSSFEGEGTLRLDVKMKSELQVAATRALTADEETELGKNCKIRIYDTDKLIRKYQGVGDIPADIVLPSGEYRVRVTAGDSVAASFDKKFYEGNVPFTLTKGDIVPVEVIANIANTVTKIEFAESLTNVFSDCQVTIAVKAEKGTLVFNADNLDRMGYFSLPSDCDTLFSTFTAKVTATKEAFEHVDTIPLVKKATLYNLTYEYKDQEIVLPDDGGGMLNLVVDATPIGKPIEEDIPYYRRPKIKAETDGQMLDLSTPYYLEVENGKDVLIAITGSSALAQVEISSEQFPAFLGTAEQTFDLKNLSEEQESTLLAGGMQIDKKENSKGYAMDILLSADLIKKYSATEGAYDIRLNVTDANNKTSGADWRIIVSNASVKTENAIRSEVWATKATLRASVLEGREPQGELTFRYRKVGDEDWLSVNAKRDGTKVWAELTGLEPSTDKVASVYEYQVLDGETVSNTVCEFTMEVAQQLENAGFEGWQSSKPTLIYGSGESMFWDSGNHGSSMASIDLTTPDSSLKVEGNYSAKLQSKNVIIKFAAGNLFVGKYLNTEGMNGVLGWGRPFSSRPIALTGYIRYTSGTVDKGGSHIAKGEQDKGQVFIALGDWKGESYNGETWPVIIKTGSDDTLFKPDSDEIIAFGEQIWEASTEGEEMHRFVIRLDYRSERIPNAIIAVASASKYGDYFEGSTGSTMWLDDLKLVYDESELTE